MLLGVVLLFTACSVNTSSNIEIDGADIQYVKDPRSGLCFAFIASRKAGSASPTGLGFTECDCAKVEHLIK